MAIKEKKNIGILKPYVAGRSTDSVQEKYALSGVVKLGSNENPLGTSPKAMAAMRRELKKCSVYPDGASSELKKGLGRFYGVPSTWVLPGNGSDEILLLIAGAFVGPGNRVLVSNNTFSQYETVSRIFDARIEEVPLSNFRCDLESISKRVDRRTQTVFLCNPNNPTGTYFTRGEFIKFMRSIPDSCLVVVDEAYAEFASAPDFPQMVKHLKTYPNLVVCRTFSKLYGLAGVRLGYALARPVIINSMQKVRNFNPFNVNRLAQAGAAAALGDRVFRNKTLGMVRVGRQVLERGLGGMGITYLPSQGNFICFKTKQSSAVLAESMAALGIIIRPLGSFAMDRWLRVTVGTATQNRRFLSALKKVLTL